MGSRDRVRQTVDHCFRHQAGKLTAVLTRILGTNNLETAEDIIQDTLLKAVQVWPYRGIPDNPEAWLMQAAKNRAIDVVRRKQYRREINSDLREHLQSEWTLTATINKRFEEPTIRDDQLRMMFICCHPALPPESQITLTLKTLGGLSVAEIAKSLLMSQEAVQKRLYRARKKLRGSDFSFDIPGDHELMERLDAVLSVLYLIFNEGYKSANARYVIRHELCLEAIRLALVLIEEPVFQKPACFALLALMHLQAARLPARIRDDGTICRIQDQDRTLWDEELIARGVRYLSKSAEGMTLTRYHLEAGIASCHSMAASFDVTDWKSILKYYDLLVRRYPSPVIKLNRAIALGYAKGPKQAIRALEAIQEEGALKEHYILFASLGEFHKQLGQNSEAKANYRRAVKLCHSDPERTLLNQSLEDCRVGYKERSKSD